MPIKYTLTVIAGILFVIGFIPYCFAIKGWKIIPSRNWRSCFLRLVPIKRTEPQKVSWLIWAIPDTITLVAMIFKNAVNGQIIGAVLGVWIVAAMAFKYGVPGWTRTDKFCLGGAAFGLILWQLFSNPVLAIVTSNIVVMIGAIPTFRSSWSDPSKEDKVGWTIFWVSCVCAVLAIPRLTWEDATQPVTFFVIETVMMYILFIRPRHSAASAVPSIQPDSEV